LTATHLMVGVILMIVVITGVIYFIAGVNVNAWFNAARVDSERIAKRFVFAKSCLAMNSSIIFVTASLGTDVNEQVHAGIIDLGKFDGARIKNCAQYPYDYYYELSLTDLEEDPVMLYNINTATLPLDCAGLSHFSRNVTYPILIFKDGWGELHNGLLEVNTTFCYKAWL